MSPVRRWIQNDFVFAGVTLALVAFTYTPLADPLNDPLCAVSFSGAEWLFGKLGIVYTADTAHRVISGGSFSMEITGLCSGLRSIALFGAVVLLLKLPHLQKALHFALGLPVLLAINVARIVHLYTLGESGSVRFALYHEWLWPSAIVAAILLYRLVMLLATKSRDSQAPSLPLETAEAAHG